MGQKQLALFETESNSKAEKKEIHHWKIFIDGASRNNPGPSGAGVYILKDDQVFAKHGFFLGNKTNNQAEYLALLLGIFEIKKKVQPGDIIHIISDSQLLIRQMNGQYKVKNEDLKVLYSVAKRWLHGLHVKLSHVLREDNIEADAMANYGIDKKIKLPHEFMETLKRENQSI